MKKIKQLFAFFFTLCICVFLVFCAIAAGNDAESSDNGVANLTQEQRDSINLLNYLSALVYDITEYNSNQVFLENVFSELENNTEPSKLDDDTLDEYEKLMGRIESFRMIAVKRERLQYIYEQQKVQTIRAAVPSPLSVMNVIHASGESKLKLIASIGFMALDSVTGAMSSISEQNLDFLQEGWKLDDKASEKLSESRTSMFTYMVRMSKNLPKGITLSRENIASFVKWKNEHTSLTGKIKWLEDNRDIYANYGEYWLVLADSYYERAEQADKDNSKEFYTKCLNAFKVYESLDNSIFRKDIRMAQSLPHAIVAAQEVLGNNEYVRVAEDYAQKILDNTNDADWLLRYFAAMTYLDLAGRTGNNTYVKKAFDIAYYNVNILQRGVGDSQSQAALNEVYLNDIVLVPTKGLTKEKKSEANEYNKGIKEIREVELPPISEALRLNCELLFALADELDISASKKNDIESILRPGGTQLFLNPIVDARYTFDEREEILANDIAVEFDKDTIMIPAMYLTDVAKIVVTVQDGTEIQTYTDWKVEKVNRNKSSNISDFIAVLICKEAGKASIKDGTIITISVTPISTENEEYSPLMFTFRADVKTYVWGAVHPTSYTRVFE